MPATALMPIRSNCGECVRHGQGQRICLRYRAGTLAFGAILLQLNWGAASAAPSAGARCERQTQPLVVEAIAEAKKLLDGIWLALGDNLYTTFRKAGERSNPFDLQAKQGPSTLEGYIWVAGLSCKVTSAEADIRVRVRFDARAVSFQEKGEGWTKPMLNRQLTEIELTHSAAGWTAREDRGEYSVLLPEEQLVTPKAEEVPKPDRRLGIPCQPDYRWTGRSCGKQK